MERSTETVLPSPGREVLPLATVLPRAGIGFSQAPWHSLGLSALTLLAAIGPGVLASDLRTSDLPLIVALGDLLVAASFLLPIGPLMALLDLADQLLPAASSERSPSRIARPDHQPRLLWLWRQGLALLTLEGLIFIGAFSSIRLISWLLLGQSPVLAGASVLLGSLATALWGTGQVLALPLLVHHHHRPLAAMDHSRRIVQANRLKILALIGLLLGLNALGLMGACLGLLFSLPLSALVLMASCRTQIC